MEKLSNELITSHKAFFKYAARLGWEVTLVNEYGVHLRKKKTYGAGYFLFGAITMIFAVGILIWLVGIADYLSSSDQFMFIPHEDLSGDNAIKASDILIKRS